MIIVRNVVHEIHYLLDFFGFFLGEKNERKIYLLFENVYFFYK